ncbi:MAG: hypothetical protein WCO89_05525 [Syntrophus sp. (in: bacteria)]
MPFQKEILRMHVMILALPIVSLIAWALFGKEYQSITIVFLMGLFYLLPIRTRGEDTQIKEDSNHGVQARGLPRRLTPAVRQEKTKVAENFPVA